MTGHDRIKNFIRRDSPRKQSSDALTIFLTVLVDLNRFYTTNATRLSVKLSPI